MSQVTHTHSTGVGAGGARVTCGLPMLCTSDAIKRCRIEGLKSVTQTQIGTSQLESSNKSVNSTTSSTPQPKPSTTSQRTSVEEVHDEDNVRVHNAGSPKNPNTILESAEDSEDDICDTQLEARDTVREKRKEIETEPEETNEDELSKLVTAHCVKKLILVTSSTLAKGLAIKDLQWLKKLSQCLHILERFNYCEMLT